MSFLVVSSSFRFLTKLQDHVFLLAVYEFLFAVLAVLVTVAQCAKKKSPNAPATPASAPPAVVVPPTGAPLASTATGVGQSMNTALPPAANAKSGMKKPVEYKSTDATAFQFTLHNNRIRLSDSDFNQSICSVDQSLSSAGESSTRTVVVGVQATGDAKVILKLKSVDDSGSAGKIRLISQTLPNDAQQLELNELFFLFFALLIL
ncbi:hypothetical protein M3Y98_00882800 [Aphelenchoides besseyi]|nr:hypothetical protein M3Y98_00882800 [Aphelenchoides besseyi]